MNPCNESPKPFRTLEEEHIKPKQPNKLLGATTGWHHGPESYTPSKYSI